AFAPDLRYAMRREDSAGAFAPHPLDERPALARLLGLTAESAVVVQGEDAALARVRPVDAELFQLRPASGVRLEPFNRDEAIASHDGTATIAVHRIYRLRGARGSYLFRM